MEEAAYYTRQGYDVEALVVQARAMAVKAGIPAAIVAGAPVELNDYEDSFIVHWGCTTTQAEFLESEDGEAWFTEYKDIEIAKGVFAWVGLPRWTVWVPSPQGYLDQY